MEAKRLKSVLLVDDEDPPRRELRREFESFRADDLQFEVFEAASVDEYYRAIQERPFDVLVVDLRLVSEEEGTTEIIAPHVVRSPSSILIVYSAFPFVRPIPSCVRAMRAGAVDCIEKGAERSIAAVVESACRELRALDTCDTGPGREWLNTHWDELVHDYGGQAIAFVGQAVVAAAPTVEKLRKMLRDDAVRGTPYLMIVPKHSV